MQLRGIAQNYPVSDERPPGFPDRAQNVGLAYHSLLLQSIVFLRNFYHDYLKIAYFHETNEKARGNRALSRSFHGNKEKVVHT